VAVAHYRHRIRLAEALQAEPTGSDGAFVPSPSEPRLGTTARQRFPGLDLLMPRAELSSDADVVVVGAGLAGLAATVALVDAG